jgi:hypothetical protein
VDYKYASIACSRHYLAASLLLDCMRRRWSSAFEEMPTSCVFVWSWFDAHVERWSWRSCREGNKKGSVADKSRCFEKGDIVMAINGRFLNSLYFYAIGVLIDSYMLRHFHSQIFGQRCIITASYPQDDRHRETLRDISFPQNRSKWTR